MFFNGAAKRWEERSALERLASVGVKNKRLKKELHSKNGKADYESANTIVLEAKAHTVLKKTRKSDQEKLSYFKGVGIGVVLILESGQHYHISSKIGFPCTNNMAEYEACILGILVTVDMNIKELFVIGDSDILIHQVQGEWSTKNVKIISYLHCVKELCKKFMKIDLKNVPRIQNKFVDALTTLSSMIQHPDKN
uniref:RNase H type-1 domain-containing protein n=1 Tax=Nicotiana tabacum TaxID=4097 RepID=A0A1S3ZJ27_TOBAC|nr:PREDICTED: uncharacterized protein LOC107787260 [Nicotiana tabacum]